MKVTTDSATPITGYSDSKSSAAIVFVSVVIVFSVVFAIFKTPVVAQTPKESGAEAPRIGSGPASSSPTIGGNGFKVPIPEIRMNRIVGDAPPKKTPVETRRGPVSSPQDTPQVVQPLHPESPKEQMDRPAPIPMRLPFDSRYRKPVSGPVQEAPKPKEEIIQEPEASHPVPEVSYRPSLKFAPPEKVDPLPEPEEEPAVEEPKEQAPLPTPERPKTTERARPEYHSPLFKEPISPVNITDSLPEPNKELIVKRMIPLPNIVEVQAVRDTIKSLPVEPLAMDRVSVETSSISVESRRAPLLVEIEEPEVAVLAKEETLTQSPTSEESKPVESLKHEPMVPPEPEQGTRVFEPKETKPAEEIKPAKEAVDSTQESVQAVEPPAPPKKEKIPSPMDESSAMTPGITRYLKETAPILEELSLLMARTPSLSISDFDPSEIHASPLPKDINLKMESMKRELRILDSKVFSIIPPAGYEQYHDLIRQSINHTYMATESFINFFNESRAEDLAQVKDHLAKAKEYIHRTVE